MKVAVFGGTGFVGSYIIDSLLDEGHSPKLLVRSESIYKVPSVSDCELIIGDVNDKDSRINNLLQVEKIDKATLKLKEERAYAVLDEIRVSPNVWYLRKVRNKKIA